MLKPPPPPGGARSKGISEKKWGRKAQCCAPGIPKDLPPPKALKTGAFFSGRAPKFGNPGPGFKPTGPAKDQTTNWRNSGFNLTKELPKPKNPWRTQGTQGPTPRHPKFFQLKGSKPEKGTLGEKANSQTNSLNYQKGVANP